MATINETALEIATIELLRTLGFDYKNGLEIAPDGENSERESYFDVVLNNRLKDALYRINPTMPDDAIQEAFRKIIIPQSPSMVVNNRTFHKYLTEGIDVEYRDNENNSRFGKVYAVDFTSPDNNDFLAVNQFTIIENKNNRRPDIILFINGLPFVVIELKNPSDVNADIAKAFNQLQTYKAQIPSLFTYNQLLLVSDGLFGKVGSLTANFERFMPWRTIDGIDIIPKGMPELEAMIKGVFDKTRLLDLIQNFIVYEVDGESIVKKIAGYHQYHAVNKAIKKTVEASGSQGDKRAGVIWHTQGSGKSLSMVFYSGKLVKQPEMENPTLIILTDRNDLDSQLFDTFSLSSDLLRTIPVQAESREDLKTILKNKASGGIIFTTIQKFSPEVKGGDYGLLSDRRNIVVITDEAHRSQYDFLDGFARHMRDGLPNASFIGFTGTPIDFTDKSTQAVFGNYIDIYDIERAVEDGATVKIYYEGRLATIDLGAEESNILDIEFEEITEDQESSDKEKLKSKWSRLEAAVGTEERLSLIANDIVEHFEKRTEAMDGKGMIVCMSRRICIDLYNEIIKLRPDWHDEKDEEGAIKVVMTGSASDPEKFQPHIRGKARQEDIKKRVKNPKDKLKLIIVRDMWLTGFDAPCLHTMYVDKPMGGHNLMQAIARVNRVFKDKEGGLIVDYLGIAEDLKKALSHYTEGSRNIAGIDQREAVAVMLEKYEIVKDLLHGFDYFKYIKENINVQMSGSIFAMDHILGLDKGKERYLQAITELSKSFALAVPQPETIDVRDEVAFFQLISANIRKNTVVTGKSKDELDTALKQLVSKAVSSNEVIDIFSAAGLQRPELSILSDEFLTEVEKLPQKNLALELLEKLLNDQIKVKFKKNVVQQASFAEKLAMTIKKYQSRTIEAAKIIAELVELAKEMKASHSRGDDLGLNEDELAFYDALVQNESASKLGDETLRHIAGDLVSSVRNNITIDWNVKESVRAKMRITVKRLLKKYDYPPDKTEEAVQLVLKQAEVLYPEYVNDSEG
jgi:type I restriction enzyme R subunit